MKLLLYCTKRKPYLIGGYHTPYYLDKGGKKSVMDARDNILNGKIIGECDFEAEEIKPYKEYEGEDYLIHYETNSLIYDELLKSSCLNNQELDDYLFAEIGYAIYIKNLRIFDEPKELSEYSKKVEHHKCDECLEECRKHCKYYHAKNNITQTINIGCIQYALLYKTPQNMCYVFYGDEKKVLISIRPEWLCKILNGEKTIEVRKRVLKEMIK